MTEQETEKLLTDALRVAPPDAATLERLRNTTEREWMLSIDQAPGVAFWRNPVLAIAASLALLVIGALWFVWPVASPAAFGVVARADAGAAEITKNLLQRRLVKSGNTLRVGDELHAHGAVLVTLSGGGTLRIAPDTDLEITAGDSSNLQHGLVYFERAPDLADAAPLRITTQAGVIQHVGTQFEVLSTSQMVRIRVREGRVQLSHSAQRTLIDAGTQLTANRDGTVTQSPIKPYGRDWLWVAALAPNYEIEGQPLLNFLQWAARELGRPLEFSDNHAREVAEHTILHGSIKGRAPLDALSSVLLTTSLTYEVRGETIWVKSAGGT
jgi:hypothetical protein